MFGRGRRLTREIEADEIFIDASNPSQLDTDQFEGRMERPISGQAIFFTLGVIMLLMLVYAGRAFDLQFINGTAYAKQAAENQLSEKVIFADRGIIEDRNGVELAYNVLEHATDDFAARRYAELRGIAHVVGYGKPPQKDAAGFYYSTAFSGIDGVEKVFDAALAGTNGITLTETDAKGEIVSQAKKVEPVPGANIRLSIDAKLTEGLYDAIAARADAAGFQGGSGVVLDVETGEIVALTSYPEYSMNALTTGEKGVLEALNADKRQPFLDRAISGLYAPGSIVKPFVGVAALTEGVIDEHKQILSTGSISVPNPYDPSKPSIFKDWKAHGWVDLRQAIAVSSDVYFYEVGGGYQGQRGLGIERLEKYLRLFGFGEATGLVGFSEPKGTIPNPAWKAATFNGDQWRVGDTYNTSIGQYGVQVTPLQAARAVAALASDGILTTPTIVASSTTRKVDLRLPHSAMQVAREGMRLAVTQGTAAALNLPFVAVAAKTGTAQVGVRNEYMNSWIVGFFPYERPRYAFAVVLERAPAGALVGAPAAGADFLRWIQAHAPHYLRE